MFWLRECTRTENYQWKEQGLEPVSPFPYRPFTDRKIDLKALPFPHDFTDEDPPDYLDVVMGYLLISKDINVPKTREMMTSWLVVGYITWFCQFYGTTGFVGQSEDDDKAKGLIKYSNILYAQQEEWQKKLHPLKHGTAEGTQHLIEWSNGSWFQGIPSGERKMASKHPHGYFNDESAHQPTWKATVNIVKPAVKQVINVSSAAPSDFCNECEL